MSKQKNVKGIIAKATTHDGRFGIEIDGLWYNGFIAHTYKASEDCILIDGSGESWVSEEFNHIREVLK